MSCIPPIPYRTRFDDYMKEKFVEIDSPNQSEHHDVDKQIN
jgi:hypothetical protein